VSRIQNDAPPPAISLVTVCCHFTCPLHFSVDVDTSIFAVNNMMTATIMWSPLHFSVDVDTSIFAVDNMMTATIMWTHLILSFVHFGRGFSLASRTTTDQTNSD